LELLNKLETKMNIYLKWFLIILGVLIYFNLGWAWGYEVTHWNELTPALQHFLNPLGPPSPEIQGSSTCHAIFVFLGPAIWFVLWTLWLIGEIFSFIFAGGLFKFVLSLLA